MSQDGMDGSSTLNCLVQKLLESLKFAPELLPLSPLKLDCKEYSYCGIHKNIED